MAEPEATPPAARNNMVPPRAIPREIWALGFVSFFMDMSSELIHSLLPVFLVSVLRAGALSVGFIEGVAEATASITKVFSGAISDFLGKRKPLAMVGYCLGALVKPVFPLAENVAWVAGARFMDRVGTGIRGAPRDALVADISPPGLRGACYGLRQTLDTLGALAGPLLAVGLMSATRGNFRLVFWFAVIPAFLAVATLALGVREPEAAKLTKPVHLPIHGAELRRLGTAYWGLLAIAVGISLARLSQAFLLLRAQGLGLVPGLVPLVLVAMNMVYSAAAYPFGRLSDRIGRIALLATGYSVFILADIVLATAGVMWQVFLGAMLWGLHLGMTRGLLSAMVADTVPGDLRGTAFGVFNFLTGLSLLPASLLAGWLWSRFGPQFTFAASGGLALTALSALGVFWMRQRFSGGEHEEDSEPL